MVLYTPQGFGTMTLQTLAERQKNRGLLIRTITIISKGIGDNGRTRKQALSPRILTHAC